MTGRGVVNVNLGHNPALDGSGWQLATQKKTSAASRKPSRSARRSCLRPQAVLDSACGLEGGIGIGTATVSALVGSPTREREFDLCCQRSSADKTGGFRDSPKDRSWPEFCLSKNSPT